MAIVKQSLGLGTSDPVASYKRIHVALNTRWYKVHGGKPILGVQEEKNTIIMLSPSQSQGSKDEMCALGSPSTASLHHP